jgi:hypothetical protein
VNPVIDYRTILKRYIDIVGEAEGTSFISGECPRNFTQQEWDALVQCNKESNDEWEITQGLKRG